MATVFHDLGIRIKLDDPDSFLKVRETLQRMGVTGRREGKTVLYQSVHILHKRGEYALLSFKELFALDGKPATITEEDLERRNAIAYLLDQWKLCKLIDKVERPTDLSCVKIIPYSERESGKYVFEAKYTIGKKQSSRS